MSLIFVKDCLLCKRLVGPGSYCTSCREWLLQNPQLAIFLKLLIEREK